MAKFFKRMKLFCYHDYEVGPPCNSVLYALCLFSNCVHLEWMETALHHTASWCRKHGWSDDKGGCSQHILVPTLASVQPSVATPALCPCPQQLCLTSAPELSVLPFLYGAVITLVSLNISLLFLRMSSSAWQVGTKILHQCFWHSTMQCCCYSSIQYFSTV